MWLSTMMWRCTWGWR